MSRVYDNWERLVEAVLDREKLKELALCESFSSSSSADFSSRFSFDSSLGDVSASRISSENINPGVPTSSSILSYRGARPIEFKDIKKATKNFQRDLILGEGGFGLVYKGWIDEHTLTASKPGSGMAIAVKKLKTKGIQQRQEWEERWCAKALDDIQGRQEWMKEINYLSKLQHPNLVKLVGYCDKEDELCLVYEFMPRGSLDNHLFRSKHESLSWATRIKVAIGSARALSFLHDMEKQVIHRCFKSANILLDKEFDAKLSDFGFARDGPTGDMTHVTTRVMGTYGYAAPEYIATGRLTAKCDVYAFGVVLLELLCGRQVLDRTKAGIEQNLVDWAKPFLSKKRRLLRIMDPKLKGGYLQEEAYKVATLALRCLNPMPSTRPRMAEVLAALEQL